MVSHPRQVRQQGLQHLHVAGMGPLQMPTIRDVARHPCNALNTPVVLTHRENPVFLHNPFAFFFHQPGLTRRSNLFHFFSEPFCPLRVHDLPKKKTHHRFHRLPMGFRKSRIAHLNSSISLHQTHPVWQQVQNLVAVEERRIQMLRVFHGYGRFHRSGCRFVATHCRFPVLSKPEPVCAQPPGKGKSNPGRNQVKSRIVSTTRSAKGLNCSGLWVWATPRVWQPAPRAARSPPGVSSIARQSPAAQPRRCTARR